MRGGGRIFRFDSDGQSVASGRGDGASGEPLGAWEMWTPQEDTSGWTSAELLSGATTSAVVCGDCYLFTAPDPLRKHESIYEWCP